MKRFSSSVQTSLDSIVDTTEDPTKDLSDWELKMSKLMGLNSEESIDAENNTNLAQEEPFNLLATDSPQESRTEQPISANPLAKLGLVATVTLGIVVLAGVFLSQIINGGHRPANQGKSLALEQKAPAKSESQELATQVEELKTKLALSGQIEAMKAAQETLRRTPRTVSVSPFKTPIAATGSVKIVYVPKTKIVTVERIVKVPQPRNSQPALVSRAIAQPIPAKSTNQPKINPTAPQEPSVVATSPEPVATPSSLKQVSNPILANSVPNKIEEVKSSIPAGTTVKAVLATSVFGETTISANNTSNEKEKNIFVVRLIEPLKSIDGVIVFPENTELLTEINTLSEQGLLQLNVLKVVRKNNAALTEMSLPKNALTISSVEGKPLIASQHPNQSSAVAGLDVGLFFLGGLSKIAELTNRTQAQVVTSNAAGSVITNANPKNNIVAGFIEGGSSSVVPQIAQRNQQAISTMTQRTNIWFIPAETQVEVHVNQLLQF